VPIGLVNDRSPLGHSGHLKLHEVVGSIDKAKGFPQCMSFLLLIDML
jgi:hypothetical protein